MRKETGNWYAQWFDTPYYHILYKDRDYEEAGLFMDQLTKFLKLKSGDTILDLACGRGRHSKYLNELGFDVTGVDLSPANISYAKQFENESLHFEVHDMCIPYSKTFDAVFNLFTSFGYFERAEDNLRTIKSIKANLNPNGFGVIDFLNVEFVANNLVPFEVKKIQGIEFQIHKAIRDGYILKRIRFSDDGQQFEYIEKVRGLTLEDFKMYFDKAGVQLQHCFGDYRLNSFDVNTSERLILIFN